MIKVHRRQPSSSIPLVVTLLLAGCDSQWQPPTTPTTGVLAISTQTTGASLDADGYTVVVDAEADEAAVGIAGTTSLTVPATAGGHTVELSGIAPNCAATGPNPRPIAVQAGGTTTTTFEVACTYVPREISFTSRRTGATDVYAIGSDEGDFPVRMTVSGASGPAWSPDGSRLASAQDAGLWVSDAEGTNGRYVSITDAPIVEVAWSPDGSRIMYSTVGEFRGYYCRETVAWIANADAGGSDRLSSGIGTTWSPDATKVAVTRFDNPVDDCPPTDIHLIDVDGSEDPVVLAGDPASEEDAVWSPDGTRIAFTSTRENNYDIYLMDADGSNIVRLTDHPGRDSAPAWSPDGDRIAFMTNRDGNAEIYVMSADGSDLVNLTNHPAWDGDPSWGPVVDPPPG